MTTDIPIITIDGLSSSGKSSISVLLAKKLGWNLLDSGLLYRAIAYLTALESKSINDQDQINKLMGDFKLQITKQSNFYRVIYKNNDITDYLNTEVVGKNASVVSKLPFIRNLFSSLYLASMACLKLKNFSVSPPYVLAISVSLYLSPETFNPPI